MRLVHDQSRVSGLRYQLWPPLVQKRPLLFVWCVEMVSSRKWLTGSDRYVLSWWNGEEMIKKVKDTHLSDDQDFDVNPILRSAHQILHHANPSLEVVQHQPPQLSVNHLLIVLFYQMRIVQSRDPLWSETSPWGSPIDDSTRSKMDVIRSNDISSNFTE